MSRLAGRAYGGAADFGLLVMRIGLGTMFIFEHGWPKLEAGPAKWAAIGQALTSTGMWGSATAWGLAAALSESVGGLLLVLGLFVRPAAVAILGVLAVAVHMHFAIGQGLGGASHAIETGMGITGLLLLGGGRWSLDHKLFGR